MSDMIQVKIDSIRANLMGHQRIITLQEIQGERRLVIWIGPMEAEAIYFALQNPETSRPLTHTLLKNIIRRLGATLRRVEIPMLRDDTFYALIILERDGAELAIDARPSDGIALALQAGVPIYVAEKVMQEAGFIPEAGISITEHSAAAEEDSPHAAKGKLNDDRLSIFEHFLQELEDDDTEGPEA